MDIPLTEGRIFVGGFESAVGYDPTQQEYIADDITDDTIASVAQLEAHRSDRGEERTRSTNLMREFIAAARANETARAISSSDDDMQVFVNDGQGGDPRPVRSVTCLDYVVRLDIDEPIGSPESEAVSMSAVRDSLLSRDDPRDVVMECCGRLVVGSERVNGSRSPSPRLELLLDREAQSDSGQVGAAKASEKI